ncbi:hypothetical protein ACJMK2_026857 [Sinanodonta woodiana]|uniref:TGS domain-containing protein n=1 Tax=Sinanodonta woodiana TaxID=1069815 RepID=A0ABD3XPB0_SINWO
MFVRSMHKCCRVCLKSSTRSNAFSYFIKRQLNTKTARKLTNEEARHKRNEIFNEERARQLAFITRIEKIQVEHKGPPEDCTLIMNKGLSTPFNCAMHIGELLMNRSVLALVNGKPWDMHRPLIEDCELQFLHMKDENPFLSNQAFWRSCSFILGYVLETAFKNDYYVELCSFPVPNVTSGSFVYDADLKLQDWSPSAMELNCLSRVGQSLRFSDFRFERLDIDASVALKMFEENRFKSEQIPQIAGKSETGSSVTVYRMGDHIDITRGPLMGSTGMLSRFSVTAVHRIESPLYGPLSRVQGIAIPMSLKLHYWTYEFLMKRATKLNPAPIPTAFQAKPINETVNKKGKENDN